MKRFAAIAGSALLGTMLATVAYAAKTTVTAEVEFATPVSIGAVTALKFGILDVGLLGSESITIGTDDVPTGDIARITGGIQAAADLAITATAGPTLTILVDNIVNNTGYTLGAFVCKYAAEADTTCNSYLPTAVASTSLLIGATLSGTGGAGVGTFNGAFDVTVLYQ
jgi:hypothetical protein